MCADFFVLIKYDFSLGNIPLYVVVPYSCGGFNKFSLSVPFFFR